MNSQNYEKTKGTEISRRSFLADLVGYGSVAAFGIPLGRKVGDNNHQIVLEDQFGIELESGRLEINRNLEDKRRFEFERVQEIERQRKVALIKAEKERKEAEERKKAELRFLELHEPGKIKLGHGSNALNLARILFGEGREHYNNNDFLRWTASAPANRSKLSGYPLVEVLYGAGAFESLDSNNVNSQYIKNPVFDSTRHPLDKVAWEKCYIFAEDFLGKGKYELATHFCTNDPEWTIGKTPKKVIGNTKFYYLPDQIKVKSA